MTDRPTCYFCWEGTCQGEPGDLVRLGHADHFGTFYGLAPGQERNAETDRCIHRESQRHEADEIRYLVIAMLKLGPITPSAISARLAHHGIQAHYRRIGTMLARMHDKGEAIRTGNKSHGFRYSMETTGQTSPG